jgi:hypothetical protein
MSYQNPIMPSGQECPAKNEAAAPQIPNSFEDLRVALLARAEEYSVDDALSYYDMLRRLLIRNPNWRVRELEIYDELMAMKKQMRQAEERQERLKSERNEALIKKIAEQPKTNIQVMVHKETNIDKNYGPNIDNQAGGVVELNN